MFLGFLYLYFDNSSSRKAAIKGVFIRKDRLQKISSLLSSNQACVHPDLDIKDPSVSKFFKNVGKLKCSSNLDWVFVHNGTFRISDQVASQHPGITCDILPVLRGKDDFNYEYGDKIFDIKNGTQLKHDFFKVFCSSKDGSKYENFHAGVVYKSNVHDRLRQTKLPMGATGLNVFMFGMDSVSRMTFMRKLPQTYDYFTKKLGGLVLEGYNIVGDGTPAALLPILTGQTEEELPEARRGHANAEPVDRFPWIWKDFRNAGYATQYAEDSPYIGTFHYRLMGFKDKPSDHYMRLFYLAAEGDYRRHKEYCLGSTSRHSVFLNWLRDGMLMYPNNPKFIFGFHSEISHHTFNEVQYMDEDIMNLLKFMEGNGYLDNTLFILMSDHGARFSSIRETSQGKLEERMPFFGLRFPKTFADKYPQAMKNLKLNSNRLTTPFDIHSTFHDLLNFSDVKNVNLSSSRGISLFTEIPKERTCKHAAIEPHWCACLNWKAVSVDDDQVKKAAKKVVDFMNHLTKDLRANCTELVLSNIRNVVKLETDSGVLKYKDSKDTDGRVPNFADKTKNKYIFYQISLTTSPGNGHFEVTLAFNTIDDVFEINSKDISRTNKYGDDGLCVKVNFPFLQPYCYCTKTNVTKISN